MNYKRRIFLTVLFFVPNFAVDLPPSTASAAVSVQSPDSACVVQLSLRREHQLEVDAIKKMLGEPSEKSDDITVEFTGIDGQRALTFFKMSGPWRSLNNAYPHSYTDDGDVRYPLALFGAELSWLIGFRAKDNGDGTWIIKMPNLKQIQNFVETVNPFLKDPISYLPVSAGYSTPIQTLSIAMAIEGEILLKFPFADGDAKLVMHELSYHLGALLYSRRTLKRAFNLNLRTQQLINFLNSPQADRLGKYRKTITDQLTRDRSVDLDFGTGGPVSNVALGILNEQPVKKGSAEFDRTANGFTLMSQPTFSPTEAVVARMKHMLMLNSQDFDIFRTINSDIQMRYDPPLSIGLILNINDDVRAEMTRLLNKFIVAHQHDDAEINVNRTTAADLANDFISNRETRIEEIIAAAKLAGLH